MADPPPEGSPDCLVVGTLGRAVGLKGEIEVYIVSDDPSRFQPGSRLYHQGPSGLRTLTVRRLRRHRERTVLSFEELGDRSAAEELKGAELVVPAAEARSLEEGEYWDHDLIGCLVLTEEGSEVGAVRDLLHTAANDVLVVGEQGEHLIPLVSAVVREVDVRAKRIVIVPLPGLLSE